MIENDIMNSPILDLMVLFTDISFFYYSNYNNFQVNADSDNDHNGSIHICSLKVRWPCWVSFPGSFEQVAVLVLGYLEKESVKAAVSHIVPLNTT